MHSKWVYGLIDWEQTKHPLESLIRKALKSVTEGTFSVAIYPDYASELKGQPVTIPLEPELTYEKYFFIFLKIEKTQGNGSTQSPEPPCPRKYNGGGKNHA